MRKAICILSVIAVALSAWLVMMWLPVSDDEGKPQDETRYGISEGLQLVEQTYAGEEKKYVVEDAGGNVMFAIPLRRCVIDTRFRGGRLRFREEDSGREGFIDRQGIVTFLNEGKQQIPEQISSGAAASISSPEADASRQHGERGGTSQSDGTARASAPSHGSQHISEVSLKAIAQSDPFYKEATKIMQGKLSEQDAKRRHMILNYCEHLRTAYTTKDIDFLRQVFSDKALIIVGNVVKAAPADGKCIAEPRVSYAIHSKQEYLARLSRVFAMNSKINVKFSGFRILRHPTMDGIYGVTLRQRYSSDRYSDDGYLFLLWDFRDRSMPMIHVRTWQPAAAVADGGDVISIQDFNLQ